MPLTLEDALNTYGSLAVFANKVPALKPILNQAMQEEWSPPIFGRKLQETKWWKSTPDAARDLLWLRVTDPATYNRNLENATQKINQILGEMGRTAPHAKWARHVAYQTLARNWDEEQLRANIATGVGGVMHSARLPANPSAPLSGEAAQYETHMVGMAENYGVALTRAGVAKWVRDIQAGRNTIDGFDAVIKARAKAQYAHLADQIDAGMTVRDVADPYIATYAQTLEVAETAIDWRKDRAIQAALNQRDPKTGVATTKPMHEFVRALKDDPRWDKTKNAQEEAYRMVNTLGRAWGFTS